MSEDPTLYQTRGDDALEARIVAWVVGEASPFEVDELKRLCAERPELEIFRRRIRAVHHLVGEAESTAADPTWRLAQTKRTALEHAFGKSVGGTPDAGPVAPAAPRGLPIWMSAAASVAILVALGGVFAPMIFDAPPPADTAEAAPVEDAPDATQMEAMVAEPRLKQFDDARMVAGMEGGNTPPSEPSEFVAGMALQADENPAAEAMAFAGSQRMLAPEMAMPADPPPATGGSRTLSQPLVRSARLQAAEAVAAPPEAFATEFLFAFQPSPFREALGMMRRGEEPPAASIRMEEFYGHFQPESHVVPTEPGGGATVDFEVVAHPYLDGRQLLRISARAAGDVRLGVSFNPERVAASTLVGFEDAQAGEADLPMRVSNGSAIMMYEIKALANDGGVAGQVRIEAADDAATGATGSRVWSIRLAETAPPLEQASASMQLATLAMIAAGKLRGDGAAATADLAAHDGLIERLKSGADDVPGASELFELISRLAE